MISNNKTPVNEFTPELWDHLYQTLETAAKEARGPKYAAFDADGTLWDTDAGENFFDWQIKNCGFKNLPPDPWKYYEDTKKVDTIAAYVWLAQISAGFPLEQVRTWSKQCFNEKASQWPVFESQRRLVKLLQAMDFEIFIVTASIKWAVEPVASLVGIDHDHVIGITTKIEDGKVGMEAVPPITWRQGKADGLLARTNGVRPILAAGNTFGDIALLETATHVQLAVSTQNERNGLFEEERKLSETARERGWLMHKFR